jgi:hypothetical protein
MISASGVEYIRLGAAAKLTGIPLNTLTNALRRKAIKGKQYRASRKHKGLIWRLELRSVQEFAKDWPHHRPDRVLNPDTKTYPGWLTMNEASEKYRIHRETLRAAIRVGKVKAVRAKVWLIEPTSLKNYLTIYRPRRKS